MKELSKKYKLIKLVNGDFELNREVVKSMPKVKVYLKNHNNKYIGIYDGGTTLSNLFLTSNLPSKSFDEKVYKICKNKKVSQQENIFFLQTYPADFDKRLQDFINALNLICKI